MPVPLTHFHLREAQSLQTAYAWLATPVAMDMRALLAFREPTSLTKALHLAQCVKEFFFRLTLLLSQ